MKLKNHISAFIIHSLQSYPKKPDADNTDEGIKTMNENKELKEILCLMI